MVDLVRLRLFRELARLGTMTAVAESLALTSSAVSQHLAILEREAGVRLLERVGRRVRLTPDGDRLAEHAETILRAVEKAELDLRGASTRPAGKWVIACFATFAAAHLLPALVRVRAQCPELDIVFHEMEPDDAIVALREGRCHLAVTFAYSLVPKPKDDVLIAQELFREPVLLAFPRSKARMRSSIDLAAFAQDDWIVGSRQPDDRLLAERACAAAGFVPRIVHAVDDYELVLKMIEAGLGVGFVPQLALERSSKVDLGIGTPKDHALVRVVQAFTRPAIAASPSIRLLLAELARQR
ncbi:LysR family transcriptional regulator [Dyella flagellata]|uniref:LysR family transcriptional regulator n=1 Tax=Dyella flagellata TaxID=1867833 RepID=A0ABQ5XAX6_9GAMM|nr:LysR family transcriptional regulator [Dyella flagellata]GLQ88788.1 LysR family transcriptional regulator [Dyella flagellata]